MVSGLELVLRYERAHRDAASSERTLLYLSLFAGGTVALACLSLIRSQIKIGVHLRRIQNDRENETRNVHLF